MHQLPAQLDRTFRLYAIYQIQTFLFAGHDTTSSSLCYAFYLLNKNLDALRKLCKEYNSVLETDPSAAAGIISSSPQILSQLVYTTAVIKEAMRLFPPALGARQGVNGVDITDDNSRRYPTANTIV